MLITYRTQLKSFVCPVPTIFIRSRLEHFNKIHFYFYLKDDFKTITQFFTYSCNRDITSIPPFFYVTSIVNFMICLSRFPFTSCKFQPLIDGCENTLQNVLFENIFDEKNSKNEVTNTRPKGNIYCLQGPK